MGDKAKVDLRVRGVYGGAWSKMQGQSIPLTKEILQELGKTLVAAIVVEAKKDLAKQGRAPTAEGQPEGLPSRGRFFESFDFRISGASTIEITCTWPWIDQIVEGRPPFKMEWLTRERGQHRVPMVQPNGTVLVRMAPLTTANAWIHPGFARHTFLERGVRKGREQMMEVIGREAVAKLMQGDPFR